MTGHSESSASAQLPTDLLPCVVQLGFGGSRHLLPKELDAETRARLEKQIEDKLALIESNLRAIREYLDERIEEVEELEDEIKGAGVFQCLLYAGTTSAPGPVTGRPSRWTVPAVGGSSPATIRSNVLLPMPGPPTIATRMVHAL